LWDHVNPNLENTRSKFILQEHIPNSPKREWITVYSGYGTSVIVDNLDPATEYHYRLCIIGQDNERSEYSSACIVKTTSKFISKRFRDL
jgi:hypothetical protein